MKVLLTILAGLLALTSSVTQAEEKTPKEKVQACVAEAKRFPDTNLPSAEIVVNVPKKAFHDVMVVAWEGGKCGAYLLKQWLRIDGEIYYRSPTAQHTHNFVLEGDNLMITFKQAGGHMKLNADGTAVLQYRNQTTNGHWAPLSSLSGSTSE